MADELNFQIPQQGFDSYLYGIIPDDQAVLAGALSVSMQQIRNIDKINIQEFAQVAYNIENMAGLPFAGGTNIPTDLQSAVFAKSKTALGSGIYGTWTMSNFFGCMSGLPYPLKNIYDGIKQLETDTLKTIYQNLYLAVTWNPAGTMTVNYTNDGFGNYTFQSVSYSQGGGYGRDGNPAPTVSIAGATGNFVIGTDPDNLNTFGKIIGDTFIASGTTTSPTTSVAIPDPPGTNWTNINTEILAYVTAANNEIQSIKTASAQNFEASKILDVCWNITGTALKQEQRARNNFAPPVTVPYDRWYNIAPTAFYVFVDSIPDLAKKTEPHQSAQTLEHISNIRNVGGQSVVGLMRESRNQERLAQVGIELDNNIPDRLDVQLQRMIFNGPLPKAVDGINGYTIPANPAFECVTGGSPCDLDVTVEVCAPKPVAFFDPNTQELQEMTGTGAGNISAIVNNTSLGPFGNGTGPVVLLDGQLPPGLPPPESACGEPPPDDLIYTPTADLPVILYPVIPIGESPPLNGSNLVPQLNTAYTASTLIPSTYDIDEAIDKVIECNCDCWVN